MERKGIRESYEKVLMIEIHIFWSPDPLVGTECMEKDDEIRAIGGLGSSVKIFYQLKPSLDIIPSFFFPKWAQ